MKMIVEEASDWDASDASRTKGSPCVEASEMTCARCCSCAPLVGTYYVADAHPVGD